MTLNQAFGLLLILGMIAGAIWLYVIMLKRSDDPPKILFKTVLTIALIIGFGLYVGPMVSVGGSSAIAGLMISLVIGLIVAILWRQHITNLMSRPFEDLFTGGSAPPDPAPYFSIARAKRQQQLFDEAIEEIEVQLERFPDDFGGLMLRAEIEAQDQQNLSGAAETIERLCAAHAESPRQVANALTALADWQLQIARDREIARTLFERIRDSFPDHPVALDAAQRIAHLPSQEMLDEKLERRPITLTERPKVVIRDPSEMKVELKAEKPDEAIGRLTLHLEMHPQDRAAREELAGLYANHVLDAALAVEQMECLLRQPGHEKQNIVRWLNLIADYHIRLGHNLVAAEAALAQIERKYPGSPAATQAERRKMLLSRELKGNEKSRDIRLGSYEKDLGLR